MRDTLVRKNTLVTAKVVIVMGLLLTSCVNRPLMTPEVTNAQPQATPTPEVTATPEVTLIDENDLDPKYVEEVSVEYMGVLINAELITDGSLSKLEKVTISENAYAEFIARSIFKIWWLNGVEAHAGMATEEDFIRYLALWAQAQRSGELADWEKVQFSIWANDLSDGNGYKQKEVIIWPMCDKKTSLAGARAVNKVSIALVNGNMIDNITNYADSFYQQGYGINIEENQMFFYCAIQGIGDYNNLPENIARSISMLGWWGVQNNGGGFSGDSAQIDNKLLGVIKDTIVVRQ